MNNKTLINQLRKRGIHHSLVLQAMLNHPREQFVEADTLAQAYEDHPLPIGHQQTISQPYIVAYMTEALLGDRDRLYRVLEIGTGSGYQAAILSDLVEDAVYTLERIRGLYVNVKKKLAHLGLATIHCLHGDGEQGYPEKAPYDGIIVTCASDDFPEPLLAQLAEGGRLVIPINTSKGQVLYVVERAGDQFKKTPLVGVRFVPLLPGLE